MGTIKPASKHCNDVILSDAKNLAFSCCYEILHSVQDDNYNCRVTNRNIGCDPVGKMGLPSRFHEQIVTKYAPACE
jgi:hypothetical protein